MLTIDDPELAHFLREEAERTGLPPAEVLQRLLDAPVPALRDGEPVPPEEQARRRAVIREAQERFAKLPVLDPRPVDELLEYDDDGLPS